MLLGVWTGITNWGCHGSEEACELAWAKKVDLTFSTGRADAEGCRGGSLGLFSEIVSLGAQYLWSHAF